MDTTISSSWVEYTYRFQSFFIKLAEGDAESITWGELFVTGGTGFLVFVGLLFLYLMFVTFNYS